MRGIGTVAANLSNRGSILLDRVPGSLVVTGNLQLAASSRVNITIGLGDAKTDSGHLEVRGDIALDGTMKIIPAGGFTPAAGQQFPVGTFGKPPTGTFAALDDSALGATLKANLIGLPASLEVQIVPRP